MWPMSIEKNASLTLNNNNNSLGRSLVFSHARYEKIILGTSRLQMLNGGLNKLQFENNSTRSGSKPNRANDSIKLLAHKHRNIKISPLLFKMYPCVCVGTCTYVQWPIFTPHWNQIPLTPPSKGGSSNPHSFSSPPRFLSFSSFLLNKYSAVFHCYFSFCFINVSLCLLSIGKGQPLALH